jgi:hypothetical protein
MPRNSEKVPSVTMSGGSRSVAMSSAFSAPPAPPATIAAAAASGTASCQS